MRMNKLFCLLVLTSFLLGCQGKNQEGVSLEIPESLASELSIADENEESLPLSEPVSVEDYIAHYYSDYSILKIIPSNLLAEIGEESLVFLSNSISYTYDGLPSKYAPAVPVPIIDKILCVFVADGRTQDHVIPGESINYFGRTLDDILTYEPLYGPWLDYCYLPDIDGDGIQEAVIFTVTGHSFGMSIWKFQDGEFQRIESENLTQNPRWQGDTQNAPD